MSAIYGIFNLKQNFIDKIVLSTMKKPIENWGTDGNGTHICENTGLGQLLRYNTPESIYERLPLVDASGNYVIVATGRIDNRAELFNLLDIPLEKKEKIPDSFIILKSFLKWKKNCVNYLFGDWSFAILDKRKKELFIARDHHGISGIFYFKSAGFFVFSSSIKSLLAINKIKKELNEPYVIKSIVFAPQGAEETAYKNIYRLPPAHHLSISVDKFEIKRYWYLENTPLLHLNSAEEYYEHFIELFIKAVKVRMRTYKTLGSTLSGGLDSGSITAIVSEEFKKQNRTLKTFSVVPAYDVNAVNFKNRFNDETPYIKVTADFLGNIELNFIKAKNYSIIQGLNKVIEIHNEPNFGAARIFSSNAMMQSAKDKGVDTLLLGSNGNAVISWQGNKPKIEFKEIFYKLRKNETSKKRFLKYIIKKLIPNKLFDSYNIYKNDKNTWRNYSSVNKQYAQKINLTKILKKSKYVFFRSKNSSAFDTRIYMLKPGKTQNGSRLQAYGNEYNLECRDPTLDIKLMEFCLSIPDNYYRQNNTNKYIIRKAMKNYLPDKVLLNKKRGFQHADIILKFRNDKEEIRQIIQKMKNSELSQKFLDIQQIENTFTQSLKQTNINSIRKLNSILLPGISVGAFLLFFENTN